MAVPDWKVDVRDALGSSLKFLLGSPQLVPEVSPRWLQACSFECVGWTFFFRMSWILDTSSTRTLISVRYPEAVHVGDKLTVTSSQAEDGGLLPFGHPCYFLFSTT